MIRLLLKKQWLELSAPLRINQKDGTLRGSGSLFPVILLCAYLAVIFLAIFGFLAKALVSRLCEAGLGWLYFSLMGGAALLVGLAGTGFTAADQLFRAKDSELLFSMPLDRRAILAARVLSLYGLILAFTAPVLLPTVLIYFGRTHRGLLAGLLLYPLLGGLILSIDCLFAGLLAGLTERLHHKRAVSLAASLLLLAAYLSLSMNMEVLLRQLLDNAGSIAGLTRSFAYPLYLFGTGACGSVKSLVLFALLAIALCLLSCLLLSRRFGPGSGREAAGGRARRLSLRTERRGLLPALLRKEWLRLFSGSGYLMNGCLGALIALMMAAWILVKPQTGAQLTEGLAVFASSETSDPFLAAHLVLFVLATCSLAGSSLSLEGESLWILRSAPLPGRQVLLAKAALPALVSYAAGLLFFAALCRASGCSLLSALPAALYLLPAVFLFSLTDISLNLRFPLLHWVNETAVLKRSLSAVLSLLLNLLLCTLLFVYYVGLLLLRSRAYAVSAILLTPLLLDLLLLLRLARKGERLWNAL